MYIPLQETILKAGGHPIMQYLPDGVAKNYFAHASDEQIKHYPKHYYQGQLKEMTHRVALISTYDKHEFKDIDPKKLVARQASRKPYKEALMQKEMDGNLTRTLGLYGTPAMAEEVGMTEEEYRGEIIKACYLDAEDPIAEWKRCFELIEKTKT
jgi:aminopeptidase